jgi:hypothetical protein
MTEKIIHSKSNFLKPSLSGVMIIESSPRVKIKHYLERHIMERDKISQYHKGHIVKKCKSLL